MSIERKQFQRGDQIATFEVGYLRPEGCNFVYVDSRLEEIWGHEIGDRECKPYEAAETRSGVYDVDGITNFAKMIKEEQAA